VGIDFAPCISQCLSTRMALHAPLPFTGSASLPSELPAGYVIETDFGDLFNLNTDEQVLQINSL
jgi:hypothetical protein